ncbi:MAG: hypothetical protein ACQERJ_01745 [Bacillota bacterium]
MSDNHKNNRDVKEKTLVGVRRMPRKSILERIQKKYNVYKK